MVYYYIHAEGKRFEVNYTGEGNLEKIIRAEAKRLGLKGKLYVLRENSNTTKILKI